jgi:thioredoxin-like negative regulator of GroEL
MAKPQTVKQGNFQAAVLEAAEPVLVDFWSPTCPHCQALAPHFEAAAEKIEGVKFVKVSTEEALPLFDQHQVNAVPVLILFKNGKELAREGGSKTCEEIEAWLKEQL